MFKEEICIFLEFKMLKKSVTLAAIIIAFFSNGTLVAQASTNDSDDNNFYCTPVVIASTGNIERIIFDTKINCKEGLNPEIQRLDDTKKCYQNINKFLLSKPLLYMSVNEMQEKLTLMETECKKI
jgi:hypothetical protein